MTDRHADRTASEINPLLLWLLPGLAMIAAVVVAAVVMAAFGTSRPNATVIDRSLPSIGSIKGAAYPFPSYEFDGHPGAGMPRVANASAGERPFAYLEFDWNPATGVPGFGPLPRGGQLIAEARK